MSTEIIVAIIVAVPALVSPLVAWFVGRIGLGRYFRELELRMKQLELLEKASSVSSADNEESDRVKSDSLGDGVLRCQ